MIFESQLTKEEFLETKKDIIISHAIPIDKNTFFVEGCVGDMEDCKKANFTGVYALLKDNKVFYIGSSLAIGRTIGLDRFREHKTGHPSNSCVVSALMKDYGLTKGEAKALLNNARFIAFKFESLEFLLMQGTPGLINSAGYKKRCGVK